MAVLLPIICWIVFYVRFLTKSFPWREAFIASSLAWGGGVVLITEVLSLAHALSFGPIAFAWIIITASGFFAFTGNGKLTWKVPEARSVSELVVLGSMAVIVVVSFAVAIIAPPNNWDSMTYHMSRVVHWLQNGSVDHYPTHILRQIYLNPWAEFSITQLQSLSNGDRLANLVQWFSMVGSLIGVTLIAKQLGAYRRGQLLAAVVAVTIPMGILQSTSTQNDYVVAFWLVCFVWYGLELLKRPNSITAVATGLSLGLAILSKGTAYVFVLPFVFWFAFALVKRVPMKSLLYCGIMVGCVIASNAGHFSRNVMLFANPLGAPSGMVNDQISARGTISNVVKNLSVHLALPHEPFNKAVETAVDYMHFMIGADVNDVATTFKKTKFKIQAQKLHEDIDGNFLHTILAVVATIALLAGKRKRNEQSTLTCYLLAVLFGFIIYCSLLKWQPWCSRLHLPLFVLFSPICGFWIAQLSRRIRAGIASILLLAALPWVFFNKSRPLLPFSQSIIVQDRLLQVFANRPEQYAPYLAAAESIHASGAGQVGLLLGADTWEYPLWVLLRSKGDPLPRIEHVDVENKSGSIPLCQFNPSLFVVIRHQSYPKVLPLQERRNAI